MKLSAYVRDRETKQYFTITREFATKTEFKSILISNGYTVVRISNNQDIAAQEHSFITFATMKKNLSTYWADIIKEIEQIDL